MKPQKLVIGAICVVFLGVAGYSLTHHSKPSMETYTVSRGQIQEVVSASGSIKPNGAHEVFATTNGIVTQLYVENGQWVDVGQELFSVKSTASPQEIAAAKAALTSAVASRQSSQQQKQLNQANLEAARTTILSAQAAVDTMERNLHTSQNNPDTGLAYTQVEQDAIRSSLTKARQNFQKLEQQYLESDTSISAGFENEQAKRLAYEATLDQTITAVVAGTVANITPDIGEEVFVSANLQSFPVLTITNFTQFAVEVQIKESDIYKIQTGQKAEITLDAIADFSTTGTVKKIDSLGVKDQGVVSYTVTLSLDAYDERMRAAMTANVSIITDQASSAMLVPNEYLRMQEGQTYLYLQSGDTVEKSIVTTGLKSGSMTQILEGLSDGSVIVNQPTE